MHEFEIMEELNLWKMTCLKYEDGGQSLEEKGSRH